MTNATEYELFPHRHRWTVRECHDMAAAGKLTGRFEILDGEVIDKMGQSPAHANVIKQLLRVLAGLFGLDLVWVQSPITMISPDNIYSEPEPDLAVTYEPESSYVGRHPGPGDLLLVIEVADTSLRTDLIVKARTYARSGIPEYWIVDLVGRQVHVHLEPVDGEYRRVKTYGETATVHFHSLPERPVLVSDLLPFGSVDAE